MVRTINRSQIRGKIQGFIEDNFGTPAAERVWFLEVGPFSRYETAHIPKAIHVRADFTNDEIRREALTYLPSQASEIIIYGEAPSIDRVRHAAEVLSQAGYGNVFIYEAGKEDWVRNGLWTETCRVPADHLAASLAS